MNKGDYVRTKKFGIRKVVYFDNDEPILDNGFTAYQKDFKFSSNINDLIQEGDYVNGEKIIKKSNDFAGRTIWIYGYDDTEHQVAIAIYGDEIKSIVTKEQFESMEYKMGE